MKRRDFIKKAAIGTGAVALPVMLGGFRVNAFANTPFLEHINRIASANDKVFVLIQLTGGNDGLNTVIPLDQYSAIMAARANIAAPEASVLKLTSETGLNPSMTALQQVYQQGKLLVVQNVGYPEPNYSHFRSTDIWMTAADYYQTIPTGWMGRYLSDVYTGYPTGFPNAGMPDPLAISIGGTGSTVLDGPTANMGLAFSDPTSFYNIVTGVQDPVPPGRVGTELSYLRFVGQQLQTFATPVKTAATKVKALSTMWPAAKANPLADQMKIVSSLIAGGLKTRVYVVTLGGFDTHYNQVTGAGQNLAHPTLLQQLSVSIQAFQDELKLQNIEDKVIGMTMSEFGRRIKSNASAGTDHGAAAPLFIFGSQVNGLGSSLVPTGILGDNPVLPASASVDDNIAMQFDFRSIYASILDQWFGADPKESDTVLYSNFHRQPVIRGAVLGAKPNPEASSDFALISNYPNPFSGSTRIQFRTTGGAAMLRVIDEQGREVRTLLDRTIEVGEHEVTFDAQGLASGTYFALLSNGATVQRMALKVVR